MTKTLMVQGTTSDAGKSVLVAGICRVLARRGVKVAPFKPQNMALNSAVTANGGEIGRAQAVQAQACGIEATTDMNPVLIKPNSDIGAQIIINGVVRHEMDARAFHAFKPQVLDEVLAAFERLTSTYEVVIVEGAGSPAEVNLRERDIANMGFAEPADVPVIIVADIDRGGVFAHLYGTLALLSASEQARVVGFVINRFRGDLSLLQSGWDWLEKTTGKPVLGVLPYLHGLNIEAEDAIISRQTMNDDGERFRIVVPILTRTSNHTDFDALRLHPEVDVRFIGKGESLPSADLIILPGTKNIRQDLAYLRAQQWDKDIARHLRFGGKVIGLCGGYQMLGKQIDDPEGIEGKAGSSLGLGYLPISTTLQPSKQLKQVSGTLQLPSQEAVAVSGYEIHAGESVIQKTDAEYIQPIRLSQGLEGLIDDSQQVFGTYLHGIFDTPDALQTILYWAGMNAAQKFDINAEREQSIERLADSIEASLDLSLIIDNWL